MGRIAREVGRGQHAACQQKGAPEQQIEKAVNDYGGHQGKRPLRERTRAVGTTNDEQRHDSPEQRRLRHLENALDRSNTNVGSWRHQRSFREQVGQSEYEGTRHYRETDGINDRA